MNWQRSSRLKRTQLLQFFPFTYGFFSPNASGKMLLETIENMSEAVPVKETISGADGFLGWMLQATADGRFDHATGLLRRGVAVVDSKPA